MPPQSPAPPISSPSPNPQYDFILRDPQKSGRRFRLPGNLTNPMKILVGLVALVIIVLVFALVFGGGGPSNSQQMIAMAGRAQEIARVSTLVQQESNDPNTQYLAATAQIAMASEQYQITNYLSKHSTAVSVAQLNVYQNKDTDTQLKTAQQNNDLEATYDSYLKASLNTYTATLQAAAKGAGKVALGILQEANGSTQVLLAAPEITSLPANG